MKGPRCRWKFVIERIWECPRCKTRAATAGNVVNWRCACAGGQETWMALVEESRRPKPQDVQAPNET